MHAGLGWVVEIHCNNPVIRFIDNEVNPVVLHQVMPWMPERYEFGEIVRILLERGGAELPNR